MTQDKIREIAERNRVLGVPDHLNRFLWMLEEPMKIGTKEQALRAARAGHTVPAIPAKPAAEAVKQEKTMDPTTMPTTAPATGSVPASKQPTKTIASRPPRKAAATRPAKAQARSPAKKRPKATGKKRAPAAAAGRQDGPRQGSKLELIVGLLQREEGCTAKDCMDLCGWPAISMPQQARAAGLKLRQKKEGRVTRYWAA